ncbi:hypothetical protein V6N13_049037 [Hibiscus sabdariffa]
MKKCMMRTKGMSSMKYRTSSQYFTLVLHHGGFMVNSPRFRYSGNKVTFFDMRHVDNMSMLEINRQLHELLEEEVVALKPHVETTRNDSDQPVRTETDIRTESVEPVTTETDIRTESVEHVTTYTNIRTEVEDDSKDSDYVGVDSTDNDGGFEESENDKTDEEGLAHDMNCLRAKNLALEMVFGSHNEQYSMIYEYLGEIRKTNPGSTTILMLDESVFLRMFICLQACKDGYKVGCRPVLSIDGCHLKGYYGRTFLAAVVVDANDNIYPIAYVVVEAEN